MIDNSSTWSMDRTSADSDEVNARRSRLPQKTSSPIRTARTRARRCAEPLHDKANSRARVSTYQRVRPGQGRHDELDEPRHLSRKERDQKFPKRIAFNVIPHIVFMEDGYTKEEWIWCRDPRFSIPRSVRRHMRALRCSSASSER